MRGVTIFKNEKNNRRVLQVDIEEIAKNPEDFEDLIDILVAGTRSKEPKKPLGEVKKSLKKKGKL